MFDKLYVQKTELEKYIEYWYIKNLSGFKGLLLIIEVKINFSLGFDNTGYQTNCKVYINYTVDSCGPVHMWTGPHVDWSTCRLMWTSHVDWSTSGLVHMRGRTKY